MWYGPAFIKIKSISIGPQIGVQSVALVLVIYNERGMEGFMENNFTLGGNAGIAAGPIGRSCRWQVEMHLTRKTILHLPERKKWFNPPLLF